MTLCAAAGLALAAATGHHGVWLIPPLGASAALVFAVTASPLAQPRPVIAGNTLSALCGLAVALVVPWPPLAAASAVALAILAMHRLGCLHPPGGAAALIVATAGGGGAWAQAVWLVMLTLFGSSILVGVGAVFHRAFGSTYPHRATALAPLDMADIRAVLDALDDVPDIALDDLASLVEAVNARRQRAR